MLIQIYAFTRISEAQQAAEFGVNHIGFVAGDYGLVHGELSFTEARRLVASLPVGTHSLALTMATDVDEILRMADAVEPHMIHISTDPVDVDQEAMAKLRQRLAPQVKLMKAIPVGGEETLQLARDYAPLSDFLLLDTKVSGMPGVGATGCIHDWRISRQVVEAVPIPVILAGGLSPENVGQAIAAVGPAGVDSNTCTNRTGDPVLKDLERIRQFVQAARAGAAPQPGSPELIV
jgi:phosphoribosylanthranilate isomerase